MRVIRAVDDPIQLPTDLEHCRAGLADEIGGNAKGLELLITQGMSVPAGVAITVSRSAAGVQPTIADLLAIPGTAQDTSAAIIALFDRVALPDSLAT